MTIQKFDERECATNLLEWLPDMASRGLAPVLCMCTRSASIDFTECHRLRVSRLENNGIKSIYDVSDRSDSPDMALTWPSGLAGPLLTLLGLVLSRPPRRSELT
jgi:hypothetical protein